MTTQTGNSSLKPSVSILMPVFNGIPYLEKSIRSILNQTFDYHEFIIVDDGSTDGSLEIIRKYANLNEKIKLICKRNSGIVDTLNEGLYASKGDIIARMDADDVALPGRLKKQVSFLTSRDDCVVVGCNVLFIDDEEMPFGLSDLPLEHEDIEDGLLLGQGEYIRHPTALFPRKTVIDIGGYRKQAEWAEDLDLYLRLGERGRLANLKDVLLHYRIHRNSVNFSRFGAQRKAVELVLKETEKRRAFDRPLIADIAVPTLNAGEWHASWSVKALLSGYRKTAKKHALSALKLAPTQPKSWAAIILLLFGTTLAGSFYRIWKGK